MQMMVVYHWSVSNCKLHKILILRVGCMVCLFLLWNKNLFEANLPIGCLIDDFKLTGIPFMAIPSIEFLAILCRGRQHLEHSTYLPISIGLSYYLCFPDVWPKRTNTESRTRIAYCGGSSTPNLDSSQTEIRIRIFAPCVLTLLPNQCPNFWIFKAPNSKRKVLIHHWPRPRLGPITDKDSLPVVFYQTETFNFSWSTQIRRVFKTSTRTHYR